MHRFVLQEKSVVLYFLYAEQGYCIDLTSEENQPFQLARLVLRIQVHNHRDCNRNYDQIQVSPPLKVVSALSVVKLPIYVKEETGICKACSCFNTAPGMR